jgi:peptidoglycan/LPS O-acetylase OafA/YrhL
MNRLFGLDLARALAISLVVLAHAHQGSREIGIYGVELFFALSGYLIGGILHRCVPATGPWSFAGVANFWQRRWWRTLPAYYLFLLVAIAFHHARGEAPEGGWGGVVPYFFFVPNLMSPNEVFFDISWSLCVEEAFYFLFPPGLLIVNRMTGRREASFVIALATVVMVSILLREFAFTQWPASQARVMTLPRLDAIGYGVAMAVWTRCREFPTRHRAGLAIAGILLVALAASAHLLCRPVAGATGFFRFGLAAIPLGFSLCMPWLASWTSPSARIEWLRAPVTSISLWSYSIYLCHHMILLGMSAWIGGDAAPASVKLLGKILALGMILLVSAVVHRGYESPLTRRRPPELRDRGEPAAAAVLAD